MWLIMCVSGFCPQVPCRPKMGRLALLQCPRQPWDDGGRSQVWMTPQAWIGTKDNLHGEPNKRTNFLQSPQTSGDHVCPATAGRLSAASVGGKLRRPQPVYLWAHPGAPVPGDVLQHDLLSQHDGPLRPGHRGCSHGGENSQWVCVAVDCGFSMCCICTWVHICIWLFSFFLS